MIGWIMYSRDDVAKAEAALNSGELGVRDEVGFLALHQALSDRFFPGTSVQHTRLRYALFVPWLLEHAEGNRALLLKLEIDLAKQLNQGPDKSDGVIGGSILPNAPVQPPSMIYWSALARWRILQPRVDGVSSSRSEVLKRIAATNKYGLGRSRLDDGEAEQEDDLSPFVKLPSPPAEFLTHGAVMDFQLTVDERKFLRRQLIGVHRGSALDGSMSLMARIAEEGLPESNVNVPWSKAISKIADIKDKGALIVAKHVAALAGIGRGVYAALVEEAKAVDGGGRTKIHDNHLKVLVGQYGEDARALDIVALKALVPAMPDYLHGVLQETQNWLRSGSVQISGLRDTYFHAEHHRKGDRARLSPKLSGKHRRAEWSAKEHPLAVPLHFRWDKVCRLLADLRAP